jgi:hypothetical protein
LYLLYEDKSTNTDADNETVEAEAEEPIHILSSTSAHAVLAVCARGREVYIYIIYR